MLGTGCGIQAHNPEWPSLPACKEPTPFFSAVHWASFFSLLLWGSLASGAEQTPVCWEHLQQCSLFSKRGRTFLWSISSLGFLFFLDSGCFLLIFRFSGGILCSSNAFPWRAWRLCFAPVFSFFLCFFWIPTALLLRLLACFSLFCFCFALAAALCFALLLVFG